MKKRSKPREDYLKAIYVLEHEERTRDSTSAVAERLGVSAPAATTTPKGSSGASAIATSS